MEATNEEILENAKCEMNRRGVHMGPLKSLERDHPLINIAFTQFCASHGIYSVEDFLLQDTNALITSAEKQSTSEVLKQGINEILSLLDDVQWSNGVELLANKHNDECALSERWESIGTFLHGGLREGFLTELVGLSSSGKTQHTVWPTLSTEMLTIESKLRFEVQKNQDLIKLLIVDSISSLITPILGGTGPNGHALMISLGYYLKKLAIEYNLRVLVTNHMVGGEGGQSKPALGESWKTVPNVRVLLTRDKESNVCNMSLLRHPSMANGVATMNIYEDP